MRRVTRILALLGGLAAPVLLAQLVRAEMVVEAGLALQLGGAFAEVSIAGTTVRAGGAASLPVVARRTAAAGLTGFEWAVGVPGSIGGAVRMNAGGHGSDLAASLTRVRVVDICQDHVQKREPGAR